jgi:predicted outer membrane repeat protein
LLEKEEERQSIFMSNLSKHFLAVFALAAFVIPLPAEGQQVLQVNSAAALQGALDGVADGGIVELAAGTYSAPAGGWTIYPDLSGGTRGFTVRAAAGAAVTLTGNGTNRILTFTTPKPVTFERITFANGLSTEEFHGGAVSVSGVQANFVQCLFQDNVANPATTGGGALWIDSSTVSFQGCVWNNNTSKNYAGAFSAYISRVYVRDSRFSGNRTNLPGHSAFNAAGCIHGNASTIQIANTRFENNQAGYVGGAIYVIGPYGSPDMNLVVTDCLFTGNVAVRDPGGSKTDPTTGGAIFMEDNTNAHFYGCRFTNNSAQQGGAISSYRTITEIKNCVLQNNTATGGPANGESLGGHIIVLSDDNPDGPTNGGKINRPSAQLTVTDSLIRGQGSAVTSARQGGAIFVAGDLHAAYGITVNQNGSPQSNHAIVNLKRVVFADLATVDSAGNGTGGAMTADFVTLNADSCLIVNCSASQYGGGFEFIHGSDATITNSTFANNSAGVLGGAITMFGGSVKLDTSNLVENKLTAPGGGSAFMASSQPASGPYPAWEITGIIQNCVISANSGGPATIYDGYSATAPFNRLQYSSNKIYPSDSSAFFIDSIGSRSVQDINAMTLTLGDRSQVTKSPIPNTALTSPASIGAILMVPQMTLSTGAPGETFPLPAYLGYASSGGTPSLDGAAVRSTFGVVQTFVNTVHTLTVAGSSFVTTPLTGLARNISTRLPVGTGQQVLIGGFIIQGPNPKTLMLRAIGPSLPLAGVLQDPYLELHDGSGQIIATNDNWKTTNIGGLLTSSQVTDIIASTIPPSQNMESAIIATLSPGSYTAVVRGATNDTGIAVVEGYDLDPDPVSKLANISTRGFILTGDNVMIGGFIFGGGPGATKVVVRGIGPSLAQFGVANPLLDPILELHDGNGATIDSNDDWITNQQAIAATGLQPSNNAESALLITNLSPGAYTAILRGKNSALGIGVLEVYVF